MKALYLLAFTIMFVSCSKNDGFYEKSFIQSASSDLPNPGQDSPKDPGSELPANPDPSPSPLPSETPSPMPSPIPSVVPPLPGPPKVTPSPTPTPVVVCDPMGDGKDDVVKADHGIMGSVIDGAGLNAQNFATIASKGVMLPEKVFFTQLNIPTRKFDEGFKISDTQLVKNSKGEILLENYGISLDGLLELRPEDPEGYYQIAFISDDGISLNVQDPNKAVKSMVSADITTPSKLSCSKMLVKMEHGKRIPISINYFQGPKYHVALVMLWRKVANASSASNPFMIDNTFSKEASCDSSGNTLFFDPDHDSVPKAAFLDLLDPVKREFPWSVVKHENFVLPSDSIPNNCAQPTVGQ